MRWLWDWVFFLGSLIAAFLSRVRPSGPWFRSCRSSADGTLAAPSSGSTHFRSCAAWALVIGYALLGASWLVIKMSGALRDWAYARVGWLLLGVLVFLALAFFFALFTNLRVMNRWLESPWLIVFPAIERDGDYRSVSRLAKAASGRAAVCHDRDHLSHRVPHAGRKLLALHDPLLGDDPGSRRAAAVALVHVSMGLASSFSPLCSSTPSPSIGFSAQQAAQVRPARGQGRPSREFGRRRIV